ncbi:MAG: YqgE/AlgH family protein [Opitutaceae bacterium]|nr:YqgE/AlgH family protein [Opitutaceae bacterium]
MRELRRPHKGLAGQLLLAHPAMRDPNFARTVILMSAHNEDGALGVVLNRPLNKQLGELSSDFASSPLAGVPLYKGGPVRPDQLTLAAWQFNEQEGAFQLYFGLEPNKATELVGSPGVTVRGFLGYAGWGEGQLEDEMKQSTWFVSPVDSEAMGSADGIALWRTILGSLDPELKLLADEPEDPTVN